MKDLRLSGCNKLDHRIEAKLDASDPKEKKPKK
jgi:hypothetical protein